MIWLDRLRYVCTWIKKVPSKNLVFNPQYLEDFQKAYAFWEHAASFKGNKQNFVQIFDHLTSINYKKKYFKSIPNLNFSFLSVLPKKTILSPKEYEQFLSTNTSLFSERFQHYDSAHLGSSRHVLLGSVQAKGIGRNMLVSRVDYIHSWGGGQELEGIYSYLISNLLNIQLPSGACPTFKVDRLKNSSAQFLRLNSSLRIAQYSAYLSADEKKTIRLDLQMFYNSTNPEFMLKKIAFHFSMSSILNIYNYSMISENILLNGAVIDCESIYNGKNLKSYSFSIDLCLEGKRAKSVNPANLSNWDYLEEIFNGEKDTRFCNSSVHGPAYILEKIQEVYEDLFERKLSNLTDEYWKNQNELSKNLTDTELPKDLVKYLRVFSQIPCEVSHRSTKTFYFNWKERLTGIKKWLEKENPFNVFFIAKENHQIFIRICFNIQRKPFNIPILARFNIRNRMDMYKEAAIFLQEPIRTNGIKTASNLNHEINRATFCLPFKMNDSGELILTKHNLRESCKHISVETKMKDLKQIILCYAYIDETGAYIENENSINLLPRGTDLVVFEIKNKVDQFKYLTKPFLVKI